jgi:hypothetical protein
MNIARSSILEPTKSLLDLAAATRAELTPLMPRDNLDIQNFIWTVGAYPDEGQNACELARVRRLSLPLQDITFGVALDRTVSVGKDDID